MVKLVVRVLVIIMFLFISGCTDSAMITQKVDRKRQTINVSAAISLKAPLEEIAHQYQVDHPDTKITFNFASSGTLQKQIEQGLPTDVFISAGQPQMERLVSQTLIATDTLVNLIGNQLVLVTSPNFSDIVKAFGDLRKPQIKHIALGEPELVPAGSYGRETLQKLGLWRELEPKLVYTKDARQVLTYVESGNVDAGLVYRSDALNSPKVQIVVVAEGTYHQPIIYPAAVLKATVNQKAARGWLAYLQEDRAMAIFREYGFVSH